MVGHPRPPKAICHKRLRRVQLELITDNREQEVAVVGE
jgi:hypothetical protein